MLRKYPRQPITNYVAVCSVMNLRARWSNSEENCKGKTAVPQMGYFVICQDTEGNEFALWEVNEQAQ